MAEDSSPSLDSLVGSRARDEHGRFASVTPTEEPAASEPKTPEPVKAPTPAKVPEPVTPPAPVAEPVAAPTPVSQPSEKTVPVGALEAERKKRQALELRLRELEAPPKPAVDPWQDLPGALANQQREFQQQMSQQRLLISEDLAREKYADFEEVITHFNEAVEANPALASQMLSARNPGEFAYRQGLLHKKLAPVKGDISELEKAAEARAEARVRAEYEAKYGKPTPAVPVSLNSDSSPAVATEVYEGPPPIGSLLRNPSRSS